MQDYFETYLENFPDAPSLVIVRSVELKNFPKEFIKTPVLDFAGDYGIFTRLMRDIGFYFYWYDYYSPNLFARGIELKNESSKLSTFLMRRKYLSLEPNRKKQQNNNLKTVHYLLNTK